MTKTDRYGDLEIPDDNETEQPPDQTDTSDATPQQSASTDSPSRGRFSKKTLAAVGAVAATGAVLWHRRR